MKHFKEKTRCQYKFGDRIDNESYINKMENPNCYSDYNNFM